LKADSIDIFMHNFYVEFVACKFKHFLPICSQFSFT